MALGYRERNERPPVEMPGVLTRMNEKSYHAKLDGFVTPVWLPKSLCEFHEDGTTGGRPSGTFVIPYWLAKRERIIEG